MENISLEKKVLPKRTKEEIEEKINELLLKMTLKEKIGQLYQQIYSESNVTGPSTSPKNIDRLIKNGQIGSILSLYDVDIMIRLQKIAVEESRLGIPLFFGNDIIHGYRTSFPLPIAMSCSWNMDLVKKQAELSAFESSHNGINMTFSPMVDLARDPRWGRVMEGNGEDPYLSSELAKAYVKGYQGDNLLSYDTVGACAKHYVGYGAAEGGRDYNTVDMSDSKLRQYYLPPFKSAVNANVAAVMTSFNTLNGVPCTGNKYLVRDILKGEFQFKGFTISDYSSTGEMIVHKYAKDEEDVARKSILAGIDHEMVSESYINFLEQLVNSGEVPLGLVDDATRRVLTFKVNAGLFDNPYKNFYPEGEKYLLLPETREYARKIAEESIVLLKNNGILPFDKTKKIAFVGPYATSKNINGAWDAKARDEDSVSLFEAAANYSNYQLYFANDIEESIEIAKECDVVVLAVGEEKNMSGEAASRANLDFPKDQKKLIERILELKKKTVLLVHAGRPLILTEYEKRVDSIIYCWFLGTESGNAILNTLLGFNNPSGKTTLSFPYSVGQIPIFYNHLNTGRPLSEENKDEKYISRYLDIPNEPLYPFGYGLSYTEYSYSDIRIDKQEFSGDEKFTVTIDVKNIGNYDGYEIVQCYIEAENFSVSRPLNELAGFKKIFLEKGETKAITFTLSSENLAYYNIDNIKKCEEGRYFIKIGRSSNDTVKTSIRYL